MEANLNYWPPMGYQWARYPLCPSMAPLNPSMGHNIPYGPPMGPNIPYVPQWALWPSLGPFNAAQYPLLAPNVPSNARDHGTNFIHSCYKIYLVNKLFVILNSQRSISGFRKQD